MLLLDWYRQWKEIRRENNRENELIETLKHEIEMLRLERDTLLNHCLNRDEPKVAPPVNQEFKPIPPNRLPWNARRQLLEANDRDLAKKLKENSANINKTGETISVDELEKEMDIAAEERTK